MIWNISLICFLGVFIITTVLAIRSFTMAKDSNPLKDYILGGSQLGGTSVISLLLSTSFGLNSIFYQIYLGYQVGIWSLLPQFAWGLSYILLGRYSFEIKKNKSLHELIGKKSGTTARTVAGFLTLIGIMFLMGWEVSIGSSTFKSTYAEEGLTNGEYLSKILSIAIVGGCLVYTVLGGLKGNAIADKFLNLVKILIFSGIAIVLLNYKSANFYEDLFPSWNTMITNLGYPGLISNLIFSLAWQFVDNSTWQNIIAGKEEKEEQTKKILNRTGILVFITPGIIGTLIGAALVGKPNINSENILTKAVYQVVDFIHIDKTIGLSLLFIVLITCIMSMLDGLFLSSSYTFVTDILYPKKNIDDFGSDKQSNKIMVFLRVSIIAIAIVSVWGIGWIFSLLGGNVFDYVYLVIVTQLALLGPVLFNLTSPNRIAVFPVWIILVVTFFIGLTCSIFGAKNADFKWLSDGAGAITAIFSVAATYLLSKKQTA